MADGRSDKGRHLRRGHEETSSCIADEYGAGYLLSSSTMSNICARTIYHQRCSESLTSGRFVSHHLHAASFSL
ncbi:hypothetical protein L227DRAFT_581736 [Lentinus tigrinus ALCF2SS1-6]|uniref:Uncharacterized protein n=1 Tax=Lentinus tigrinus ALCF2SS1-6 TaxID=1328759 RepID=A0A5C2RN15_9APHY|nr:hypothetical protein L227DRAFT_581736 [Lentinus tigrinus ALCF2SS1-6]